MSAHPKRESFDAEVVIIGGGVAGLAAARQLATTGSKVILLEARNRLGGRVHTEYTREDWPIELGAEFVHGKPPQIFDTAHAGELTLRDVAGTFWRVQDCQWSSDPELLTEEDDILGNIRVEGDISFLEYLNQRRPTISDELKKSLLGYINGFHAADPARISSRALAEGTRAQDMIGGEQNFRIAEGYSALVRHLASGLESSCDIRLKTRVRAVEWKSGSVEIAMESAGGGSMHKLQAQAALITLPVSLLKQSVLAASSTAIHFQPALTEKRNALEHLEMGSALRISLCFKDRFWRDLHPPGVGKKNLDQLCFAFSQEKALPTWWTKCPARESILTGWAGGAYAAQFAGSAPEFVCEKALETLSHLFSISAGELRAKLRSFHVHDWDSDEFSRGAYSYALVGGANAFRELAQPLAQALFFAGEATDFSGHNATVHGAIASGERAAQEIITNLRERRTQRSA